MSSDYEEFNSNNYNYPTTRITRRRDAWQENKGLRIHFTVFLSTNMFLLFMDIITGFHAWFVYPLISWGIAMSIHFFSVFFSSQFSERMKRGLYIHGAVQGTLVLFFFLMDFFTSSRITWAYYPALPLIIAWGCHYGLYRVRAPQTSYSNENKITTSYYNELLKKEMAIVGPSNEYKAQKIVKAKLSVYIHGVFFSAILVFLLVIDVLTNPFHLWFYWPMLPWALGLACHALAINQAIKFLQGQPYSKWYVLSYPGALCGFLFAIDILSGFYGWFIYPTLPIMGVAVFVIGLIRERRNPPRISNGKKWELELIHKHTSPKVSRNVSPKSEIPLIVPGDAQTPRYCASCGAPVDSEFKYCQYCGYQVRL